VREVIDPTRGILVPGLPGGSVLTLDIVKVVGGFLAHISLGTRYAVGPTSLSGQKLLDRASLESRSVGAAAPMIAPLSATAS
jgi:hypothetical protein